ncbi:histidine--tRNA ligase [Notoacmeibacter sp. MSK16QG-6]|uniref:histidine--tRNA ligase n=1 Tax=Notoacmeibacter sp. MSK16QG-6 TaxID=2957982 RepID=UPI00209E652F|nr:histidine--tRNA ligase [Notoacmeibacter sp. MSK16QG-6]MCP1198519.1 histidine--tRNA ligase [Notoacmeibacter sp. MSK16QG-6]
MAEKKKKKPQKLKARLPRGFADRSPEDIRATDRMMAAIKRVYESYGFQPVETPMFEYTDALGKFLPDQDRPNEGVFSLQDDDEQWMSLRYDLTAPLARHVAENFQTLNLPYRTYRAGWVFRNEKPGPGRFRQFMQFDADVVGAPSVQTDAEMCMMMADTMEELGLKPGQYVIRVNNRKVLDGVMEAIGLGGAENAGRRLTVLRAIDKLDRLGIEGVRQLLGEGRWDGGKEGEGDFTPGAGLKSSYIGLVVDTFLNSADAVDTKQRIASEKVRQKLNLPRQGLLGGSMQSPTYLEGQDELSALEDLVLSSGYDAGRILVDPSVVRGLEYYTGPVYEAELLFDVVNDKGEKVQFGSVGGGGRYDGLVKRFTGQDVPATGFSIGVSRLMTALKNLDKLPDMGSDSPVLVTVMDKGRIGDYAAITKALRDGLNAGRRGQNVVAVEMYQGNPNKFGKQLQYADRRGCPLAIIQGSDEMERGIVQVKDLIEGRKQAAAIESNEEWRETRPGQFEVDVSDGYDKLIEAIRERLSEQAAERAAG